jgi:hypothetical protein
MISAIYKDNFYSLCDVKEAITNFIRNISHTELVQVFVSKIKRADTCLLVRGDHFQHLL